MLILPAFGRQRQGAQALRVILGYTVNLRRSVSENCKGNKTYTWKPGVDCMPKN